MEKRQNSQLRPDQRQRTDQNDAENSNHHPLQPSLLSNSLKWKMLKMEKIKEMETKKGRARRQLLRRKRMRARRWLLLNPLWQASALIRAISLNRHGPGDQEEELAKLVVLQFCGTLLNQKKSAKKSKMKDKEKKLRIEAEKLEKLQKLQKKRPKKPELTEVEKAERKKRLEDAKKAKREKESQKEKEREKKAAEKAAKQAEIDQRRQQRQKEGLPQRGRPIGWRMTAEAKSERLKLRGNFRQEIWKQKKELERLAKEREES